MRSAADAVVTTRHKKLQEPALQQEVVGVARKDFVQCRRAGADIHP